MREETEKWLIPTYVIVILGKTFHYVNKKIHKKLTYMLGVGNLKCLPC